jgi:hypothetical protein
MREPPAEWLGSRAIRASIAADKVAHPGLGEANVRLDRRRQRRAGCEGLQSMTVYGRCRARLAHEIEERALLQQHDQMCGIEGEGTLERLELILAAP